MRTEFDVVRGSGNLFVDFDDADAEAKQLKAQVAAEILNTLNHQKLSARAAAKIARVDPADIQRIRNADLSKFTLDRLIRVAYRLGRRIEIKISPVRRRAAA
jgi:predicted XRE-type DNA-binding protein